MTTTVGGPVIVEMRFDGERIPAGFTLPLRQQSSHQLNSAIAFWYHKPLLESNVFQKYTRPVKLRIANLPQGFNSQGNVCSTGQQKLASNLSMPLKKP